MTEEERDQILAEAANILERTKDLGPTQPVELPSPRDRVAEWKNWHDARAAEQRQAKRAQQQQEQQVRQVAQDLDIEQRIAEAIAREHELMVTVFGEFVGQVRAELRQEIEAAYAKQMNIVRLDIDALRHTIQKFMGADVLELPNPLQYRTTTQVN